MDPGKGTVSILISVIGATKEPFVSAAALRSSEAVELPASVTRSQGLGGIEFVFRLNAPAGTDGILVRGEFEFTDANVVKVSIRKEASPSTAARNLSIAVAGGTATFETFQPVEATLQRTVPTGFRGVRPTTRDAIEDLLAGDATPGKVAVARKFDPPREVDYEVWFGTDRGAGVPDGAGA